MILDKPTECNHVNMPFKSLTRIGLTSIWFGVSTQIYPSEAKPLVTSDDCNTVGRVVKIVNSQLPAGKLLCREDSVRIAPSKQLRFACYASGLKVTLSPGVRKIADHCGVVSHRYRRCTNQITTGCIVGRNPNISTRATLFVPYSATVLEGRPNLLWEEHSSADRYTVELFLSNKMLWKQTVKSNAMPYPSTVQTLEQGKAYLIRVSAYRGGQMLHRNISVLNRISAKKVSRLKSTFRSIDALKIPVVEKVFDKEKIYLSQGLLSESIEILKSHLRRDPYNPAAHRLMGDRFMNAGLPKLAQPYFIEAKALADKKQNMQELAKANEGLAEIAALPINQSKPSSQPK